MGEFFLIMAICVVGYVIYRLSFNYGWRRCEEAMSDDETTSKPEAKPVTAASEKKDVNSILHGMLPELQCKILSEEDGVIEVRYQAEHYRFVTDGDRPFLWVYDLGWYVFPEDDIDTFAKAKNVINEANSSTMLGVVYNVNEEDHVVSVSTKYTMYVAPDYHDNVGFLEHILDECASLRQTFKIEMESQK